MKRSEVPQPENNRIRVTYKNKVGAINKICGNLISVSKGYIVWRPFGSMGELSKRLEDVINVEPINGH